ncbi:hypothetical protein HER21_36555, partial [Pseudomonas sp. BGM005]|nr:hypothetical protein [Pseudomonas sp. BG5]
AITDERRRMAVAIPALSKAAEEALAHLTVEVSKDSRKLNVSAASLDPGIGREFAAVSQALDERFGRDAIARGDKDLINSVPPAQRAAFATMREKLKVLQQTLRQESSQQIISERRQRNLQRSRGL